MTKRPAHWGPYSFFCGLHHLHGFFGLYSYCPMCAGVSPLLLIATRDRMLREGREVQQVPAARPVVRLVAPPPPRKLGRKPPVPPKPATVLKFRVEQLHGAPVLVQRRERLA